MSVFGHTVEILIFVSLGWDTLRESERIAVSCRFTLSSCVVVFEYCISFSRMALRL